MLKNFILIAVIILTVLVGGVFGARHLSRYIMSRNTGEKVSSSAVINLSQPTDSKLVEFETDRVIISFSLDAFKKDLKKYDLYDQLLTFVEREAKTKDKIKVTTTSQKEILGDSFIGELLEQGNYLLFDKKTNRYVDRIKFEKYSYYCGSLCGEGGRRFILLEDSFIFFKVVDSIS